MTKLEEALNKVDRVTLGTFPTPIHRLQNMEKELSYCKIYIKRDDLTGIGPGGNKIRSLEFILGEAKKKKKNFIIASGPPQSNLCTLTAASCAKLGLKCALVHNGDKPEKSQGNLLLNQILGAESYFIGNGGKEERDTYVQNLVKRYTVAGYLPYVVENGATTGMGALGYVNAVLEIKKQCEDESLNIKSIYAPGGNGGVATGLIYGNALLGNPFEINIVSVEDSKEDLIQHIKKTIAEVEEILGLAFDYPLEEVCNIIEEYRGEGWGINTKESAEEVLNFAKTEGIFIENVYNSKLLVGMKDRIKKGKVIGDTCYLHTGGFGSLFDQF